MSLSIRELLSYCGVTAALIFSDISGAASLDSVQSTWPELSLKATINSTVSPRVEQGSNMEISISAEDEAAVAIVLVSAEGKARVLTLNRGEADNRVTRGTPLVFPDLNAGETLYANLPVGKANAYVIASREPIFASGEFTTWQTVDAVEQKVARSGTSVDIERLPFYVTSSQSQELVTEEEFVRFFAEATRDVKNPSKGFPVEFESGSAEITAWGKRQLDSVGQGMNRRDLAGKSFRLEGHTDDVGTDEFNMDLSARRAQSVRNYLVSKGVKVDRIETMAMGEAAPVVPGQSAEARKKNRRVEIRRIDE